VVTTGIVMWQPGNHPDIGDADRAFPWVGKVYDAISQADPSRLIAPTANISRMAGLSAEQASDPRWTAPLLARGNMDTPTGYGKLWTVIREWPGGAYRGEDNWDQGDLRIGCLRSRTHAYFNFENEESVGQPNWELRRGHPTYHVMSYELDYDAGSIGRRLSCDEWRTSQAWQAFSAYESVRKQRWVGYDGFAWCCLRGGGNTATYLKPVVDYFGHAKLAYYALAMAYQPVLAGSHNVDVVYGPEDVVTPMILNLGPARRVALAIVVRDLAGCEVARHTIADVALAEGRTVQELPAWSPDGLADGTYLFEYEVADALAE
jgi:hypothetical protein